VPDQHGGDRVLLGHRDQGRGDLPDLGDPARRRLHAACTDGLHGIDDQQLWLDHRHVPEQRGQVGLRSQVEVVGHRADPVRAQPHLGG
jgi:hypothetical protein